MDKPKGQSSNRQEYKNCNANTNADSLTQRQRVFMVVNTWNIILIFESEGILVSILEQGPNGVDSNRCAV
ncbi:unnamed protein product [Fusarium graminearum]|nr:unnamed protein product [Fusarium graminearum]